MSILQWIRPRWTPPAPPKRRLGYDKPHLSMRRGRWVVSPAFDGDRTQQFFRKWWHATLWAELENRRAVIFRRIAK